MKQLSLILTLFLGVLLSVSCYHARIETGLTPSTQVIEKTFAASWIYGLVPPSTISTAKECEKGVAIVETEHSFVNQLVGILTFGIYTPIHIKVTCAAGSNMGALEPTPEDLIIPIDASQEGIRDAFALAAERTVASKHPVYVRFE